MGSGNSDDWMLVGRVGAALGVHGELKVQPFTDFPERFARLGSIFLGSVYQEHSITSARKNGDTVILSLRDVTSREEAQSLRGMDVWIPRSEAVQLPQGQYYHDDIVGLLMETRDGTVLGTVTDILVTGANDVYVVSGEDREVLVPAIRDVVLEIDVPRGRIVIDPIPGLLE